MPVIRRMSGHRSIGDVTGRHLKCRHLKYRHLTRRSSTRTQQLAIGRVVMIRIPQAPSVIDVLQQPSGDRRRGTMRLGRRPINPAKSLFRQKNSLFGLKNSLFSFEQGIRPQAIDSALKLAADRASKQAKTCRNLAISLFISLFAGNPPPRLTRSVTTRSPLELS